MEKEKEVIRRFDGLTIKFREDPKPVSKGLREFEIEGIKINAINQKNAQRKYNKLVKA